MDTVERRLESWTKALLDLSFRNRLLNVPLTSPSAPRQRTLRFQMPSSAEIYSMLLGESKINVLSPPDPNAADTGKDANHNEHREPNRTEGNQCFLPEKNALPGNTVLTIQPATVASKIALRLMRQGKATLSEQGINSLYATFGVLKWRDNNTGQDRRAPLLLVPVELIEDTRNQIFQVQRFDEGVEFNLTLAERLHGDFGLSIAPPAPDEGEEYSYELVTDYVRDQIQGRGGWEILDETNVGNFQFHKLRMVRDLREHVDVATGHPIIQALATDGMQIEAPVDPLLPADLDLRVAAEETYSILDADSSQMSVIETVKRGAHVIIQGPPGTGKSQTIANVIAETIAQGKTVLFVSEKAAALDVVYRRLEQAGLGSYCLPLHSHKANKTEVINNLYARMEEFDAETNSGSISQRELKLLDTLRQRLNAYPDALHRIREPFGRSLFNTIGSLAELSDVPDAPALPIPSVTGLTDDLLETWVDAIARVARYHSALQQEDDHIWAFLGDHPLSFAERDDLLSTLASLNQVLEVVTETAADLSESLGVPPPACVADTLRLDTLTRLVPEQVTVDLACLQSETASKALRLVREAQEKLRLIQEVTNDILTVFDESIFSLPHTQLASTYQQGLLSRIFSSSHRRNRKALQAALAHEMKISESQEHEILRRLAALSPEIRWFNDNRNDLSTLLNVTMDRPWSMNPDVFDQPLAQLEQLEQLRSKYPSQHLPPTLVAILSRQETSLIRRMADHISHHVRILNDKSDRLRRFARDSEWRIENRIWRDVPIGEAQHWVAVRLDAFSELDTWLEAQSAMTQIRQLGLDHSIAHLAGKAIDSAQWVSVFKKRIISRWIAEQMSLENVLASFDRQEHEETISKFRDLDTRGIASGSQRVHERLSRSRQGMGYGTAGEPEILRRNFAKRRNKYPPRILFQKIPNLLQELKPCLMMSPLSVAHFLPAHLFSFDLVIFDEASQVRPHDAIGAIMRGKQLAVAGDRYQLPPTTFFDTDVNAEENEEDSLSDMESILDALDSKGIRSLPLLWHYRSRHEDLIAFSNHFIYNNTLRTFPTPVNGRLPDAGVHFRYVENGRLTRQRDQHNRELKRNEEEVQVVLEEIRAHFRSRPDQSLGVVALNKWHTEAIWDAIHELRLLDRQLDQWLGQESDEPFFVKNLEEVQGDQRDVMIISIGFAKERAGADERLNHNFGPINQDVGRRRINVLVTRTKHKLILVSSIRDEDIEEAKVRRTGGMWLLKQYLAYAESGSQILEQRSGATQGEAESEFEREVAREVARLGYDVHLQVGVSRYRIDIGVIDPNDPNRYILGIECDGATYHSSRMARDRDRLRQDILEGHGWRLHRIWSTQWFRNRDAEVRRLADALERITQARSAHARGSLELHGTPMAGPTESQVNTPAFPAHSTSSIEGKKPTSAPAEIRLRALPSFKATTYQVANLDKGPHWSDIHQASSSTIERMILQCVEIEGPIHIDLLVRRITSAWGYGRAGARIRNRIEQDMNRLLSSRTIERSGDFLTLANQSITSVRGADEDGNVRKIDWISPEELRLAFQIVLQRSLSLSATEMITETARYLGYDRTGAAIKTRLDQELNKARAEGRLEFVNGRYQLANPQANGQHSHRSMS